MKVHTCDMRDTWISVKERLPKPSEDVRVLLNNGKCKKGYIGKTTGFWFSGGCLIIEDVTHWMPERE